jgi:hypothetical protein
MIWELCAKFIHLLFLNIFFVEITWYCPICGEIFPIDSKYIDKHMLGHKK